jgi:hypothetical protein
VKPTSAKQESEREAFVYAWENEGRTRAKLVATAMARNVAELAADEETVMGKPRETAPRKQACLKKL